MTYADVMKNILGTSPEKNKMAARKPKPPWNPKELTPQMKAIMDYQIMNPGIKVKEIAELVKWSPQRVKRIMRSDVYKMVYKERQLEIDRLQHSQVARDRAKFQEIRDRMVKEHLELVELDPDTYKGKELEAHRLRQKSISELLSLAETHLEPAKKDGEDTKITEERTRELEIDITDPNAAYVKIMESWRRGTK